MAASHETSTTVGLWGAGLALFGLVLALIGLFSTFMLFIGGFLLVAVGLVMFMLARRRSRFAADLETPDH